MTNKEPSVNTGYVDSVKILDVEKRKKSGPKYYAYVIQVTWSNPANLFIIYRRYTEFFDLQCKLLDLFAETPLQSDDSTQSRQIPFLPGKIILGRSQTRQIALQRKEVLNEYCQNLISLPERISRSRPILEFFHPLATDVQKPIESLVQEKKPIDKSSLVISPPSKLATYRCLANFTATDKLELSLKRHDIVQVLHKHPNGWWFVQYNDQTGFVPGAYLEPSELQRGAREGKTFEKSLNETYVVNNKYEGKGKDELSLDQGSFVTVVEKSFSGWWTVKFNDITGQFPAIYLTSCEGRHTPGNVIDDTSSVTSKIQKQSDDSSDSDWEEDEEYHTGSSNNTKSELYYAHSSFNDHIGDCLSFQRGEIIEIHDKHPSGWWFGRRMKGGDILSWIPANYLQKEPILDATIENKNNQSSNMPNKVLNSSVNKQQKEKEKPSVNTINRNLQNQASPNTKQKISTNTIDRNLQGQTSTNSKEKTSTNTINRNVQSQTLTNSNEKISTNAANRNFQNQASSNSKQKISTNTIERNLRSQTPTNSNVIKKQQPIITTLAQNKSSISTSLPHLNDNKQSTSKSVKDLVNRFNRE